MTVMEFSLTSARKSQRQSELEDKRNFVIFVQKNWDKISFANFDVISCIQGVVSSPVFASLGSCIVSGSSLSYFPA